jgi:hypothetical protein
VTSYPLSGVIARQGEQVTCTAFPVTTFPQPQ